MVTGTKAAAPVIVSTDKMGDGLPGQVRQCRRDTYSEIASLDGLAQRLYDVGKVLEMRVDRESAAIRLQRMLVVANLLQDEPQPRQRPEMPRFAQQHFTDIGDRMPVILHQIVDRGPPIPGFHIVRLERNDGVEQLDR